jgi:hypothetical protein
MIVAAALAATIWGAVTGFYGTRHWAPVDVCKATYRGDRFALVQARIRDARHVAVLRFQGGKRGWTVLWADGRMSRKLAPSTAPRVLVDVTRLKAKCLAP